MRGAQLKANTYARAHTHTHTHTITSNHTHKQVVSKMEHAQTQAVRFKGYVRKKGQINPAWKTRFFVLQEDGTCSYYATEAAFEQHKEKKGDFVCRGARLVANAGSDDKNGFLFNVHLDGGSTDDRVIECAVDTAASRDAWVMSLSAASMGDDCVVAIQSDGAASADGGGGQAEQAARSAEVAEKTKRLQIAHGILKMRYEIEGEERRGGEGGTRA